MQRRSLAAAVVVAFAVAACSSEDSGSADTEAPEITLLTTTTLVPPTTEAAEAPESTAVTSTTSTTTSTTIAATTTTTEPPPNTTAPATTIPPAEFELRNDGLGAVAFGAEPEGVISFVSSFIGPPTADTGWVDPFSFGPCGGTQLRQVSWNTLTLEFGDSSVVATGRPHFYAYYYGIENQPPGPPFGITTPEGITVGSTVAALIQAYPTVDLRSADEFIGPNFIVNDNLRGGMTGLSDADTVSLIIGGQPCDG